VEGKGKVARVLQDSDIGQGLVPEFVGVSLRCMRRGMCSPSCSSSCPGRVSEIWRRGRGGTGGMCILVGLDESVEILLDCLLLRGTRFGQICGKVGGDDLVQVLDSRCRA